jgi:iron complex transport system permease protein
MLGLALVSALTLACAPFVGRARIGLGPLLSWLWNEPSGTLSIVFWQLRVPRVVLGMLVGAALAAAGAAMQEWMHNSLAEPGTGGVSSAAALGAVLALYMGSSGFGLAVPVAGMAGALLGALAVWALAGRGTRPHRVLLAGLVLASAANALIAVVLTASESPMARVELIDWLLGSLSDKGLMHVRWAALPIVLGLALLVSCGRALRVWSLGEEAATSLGIHRAWLGVRVLGGCTLAVGAAVSVSGTIGFVGLFVPHLLRPLVGADPARLLPASALGGAVILAWADAAVRVAAPLLQGAELKLGVMTALLGTPLLLVHALRAGREEI